MGVEPTLGGGQAGRLGGGEGGGLGGGLSGGLWGGMRGAAAERSAAMAAGSYVCGLVVDCAVGWAVG